MCLQMKLGFTRLQATWRARKLTRDYRKMRRCVYLFQSRCRGMLRRRDFRRGFRRGVQSIIIIQRGVRKALAIRKANKMCLEVSMLLILYFSKLKTFEHVSNQWAPEFLVSPSESNKAITSTTHMQRNASTNPDLFEEHYCGNLQMEPILLRDK